MAMANMSASPHMIGEKPIATNQWEPPKKNGKCNKLQSYPPGSKKARKNRRKRK